MSDFLIESYNLDNVSFTKPKKNGDYLVSKIKYLNDSFKVQFPKMKLVSEPLIKNMELEFLSSMGYNKKSYNFLSKLDLLVIDHITSNSEEWFGKKIPSENISNMYNKFIKAPKTSDNNCTVNFNFKSGSVLDKNNEEIDFTEIKKGMHLECISQMKYIIFSKDIAFVNWEICTVKVHKPRGKKVTGNGFIEDPMDFDEVVESDEELDINSFF